MKIITVIAAKGGCGKSTLAINLAAAIARGTHRRRKRVLLIDMDPQAQLTEWLGLGDGLTPDGTITLALRGDCRLKDVIQETHIDHLWFVASSQPLEDLGHEVYAIQGHEQMLLKSLEQLDPGFFDYVVIDSPNQISPIMRNTVIPADLFVVPFESMKTVKSYANFFDLVLKNRIEGSYQMLHVLNNIPTEGLRKRILETIAHYDIQPPEAEVRYCGWLARVDDYGGSIFEYRPNAKGAKDILELRQIVLEKFARLMAVNE